MKVYYQILHILFIQIIQEEAHFHSYAIVFHTNAQQEKFSLINFNPFLGGSCSGRKFGINVGSTRTSSIE